MPSSSAMPAACRVCGSVAGVRDGRDGDGSDGDGDDATGEARQWRCARCGWRLGDAPDADLPRPRVDVVYYLRFDRRVKIGTSSTPRRRLAAIRHDELLTFESGGRDLEQRRHREFAELREGGEWFTLAEPLTAHLGILVRAVPDPWAAYDRWLGDAYRALSS